MTLYCVLYIYIYIVHTIYYIYTYIKYTRKHNVTGTYVIIMLVYWRLLTMCNRRLRNNQKHNVTGAYIIIMLVYWRLLTMCNRRLRNNYACLQALVNNADVTNYITCKSGFV